MSTYPPIDIPRPPAPWQDARCEGRAEECCRSISLARRARLTAALSRQGTGTKKWGVADSYTCCCRLVASPRKRQQQKNANLILHWAAAAAAAITGCWRAKLVQDSLAHCCAAERLPGSPERKRQQFINWKEAPPQPRIELGATTSPAGEPQTIV